jgi:hypothetical protein
MGVADFLTEGTPSVAQPYASTREEVLPDWYTNYAMDVIAQQGAIANRPYSPYQGPSIAPLSGTEQLGIDTVKSAAGMSGVNAANPYFAKAGMSVPEALPQYMNPYIDNVVNRIGQMGTRTLQEQVLPGISDQMTRAGQFGGTRQAELMGRAIRDAMEGISAQQAAALSQGYTGALTAAGNDLTRMGNLGETVGGLTMAEAKMKAGIGSDNLMTAGGLERGIVQKNYDVAKADATDQMNYDQKMVDASLKTLTDLAPAVPKATLTTGYGAPGDKTEAVNSPLAQAGSTVSGFMALYKQAKEAGLI